MTSHQQHNNGLAFALSAFVFWGLTPVYFKAVDVISPMEVLCHRILWSVVVLFLVLTLRKQWQLVRGIDKRTLRPLLLSSFLISVNWLVFIWAIGQNRILETSLGYFINPLVSLVLGMLFLGERLRRVQALAVLLAVLGVANQLWIVGNVPWIALFLAFSFGFYGLIRKKIGVEPVTGLFLETSMMLPLALAYFLWLNNQSQLGFMSLGGNTDLLLLLAGVVTTIPLLLFAAATQRLSLTVIGLVQYTAPTITFLLAIFLYHEPFSESQLITFAFIWIGLALFSAEGIYFRNHGFAKVTETKAD